MFTMPQNLVQRFGWPGRKLLPIERGDLIERKKSRRLNSNSRRDPGRGRGCQTGRLSGEPQIVWYN
jgi:hypothetical protein